jgi:hypothetical protein
MTTPKQADVPRHPIGPLLDSAGGRMLALEEVGSFPSELRVSPVVYASFAHLRQRELAAGYPLLVLGATVVLDPTLGPDEFQIAP